MGASIKTELKHHVGHISWKLRLKMTFIVRK